MPRLRALTLATASLLVPCSANAVLVFQESFETDGNGSRYVASTPFNDGSSDHWNRTDGSDISNISGPYSGFDGNFFWAAEDTDDNGGNGNDAQTINFSGISIAGFTDVTFSGLFGAGNESGANNSAYDAADFVLVEFNVDGSGFTPGLQFSYVDNGDDFNEPIAQDTNFDGDGDGTLLSTSFADFGFSIPEGSSLDLRITVSMDSGNEEIGFDNIQVNGVIAPIPEPTAALFGSLLAAGLGMTVGRRRQSKD